MTTAQWPPAVRRVLESVKLLSFFFSPFPSPDVRIRSLSLPCLSRSWSSPEIGLRRFPWSSPHSLDRSSLPLLPVLPPVMSYIFCECRCTAASARCACGVVNHHAQRVRALRLSSTVGGMQDISYSLTKKLPAGDCLSQKSISFFRLQSHLLCLYGSLLQNDSQSRNFYGIGAFT